MLAINMRWVSLIIACLLFSGCLSNDCVNVVREELVSPNGKLKAVVFSRNCGATTGANIQVSVLDKKENLPNDGGNALIVDNGDAKVSWKKEGGLLVTLDSEVRVFKKETVVHGADIEYRNK